MYGIVRDFLAPMMVLGVFIAVEVTCIGVAVRDRDTQEGIFWVAMAVVAALVMAVVVKS